MVNELIDTTSPSRQAVKWKPNSVIFFHTSPTIQSIQKSISTLGSSDKDKDEMRVVKKTLHCGMGLKQQITLIQKGSIFTHTGYTQGIIS